MGSIAYVNGRYAPSSQAALPVFDRATTLADGVYEVIPLKNGQLIDGPEHMERLTRSLAAIALHGRPKQAVLKHLIREVIRRNHARNSLVYLQITRGTAPRDHAFPSPASRPSLVIFLLGNRFPSPTAYEKGATVITRPDLRWGRCDIKSTSLLPNVLAKEEAVRAGAKETWLIRDGMLTEGSSSNAFILNKDKTLWTHPANTHILNGITRMRTLELARALQWRIDETPVPTEALPTAAEAFMTSSSMGIMPVTHIDGQSVGSGAPGPLTRQLRDAFLQYYSDQE